MQLSQTERESTCAVQVTTFSYELYNKCAIKNFNNVTLLLGWDHGWSHAKHAKNTYNAHNTQNGQ